MRIFYGVQGTGNGHITRARVMAKELTHAGFDVDYMFTGRPVDKYFDMEIFNNYQTRKGLTFNINNGHVNMFKTIWQTKPFSLIQDIKSLDLSEYDLVISDFEPVTSWAGKVQKKHVLGIGHQYAFAHPIPRHMRDPLADWVMKTFAPVTTGIGLHWHHFEHPILPPIINTYHSPVFVIDKKIIVYLPFENQKEVMSYLAIFPEFEFHVYTSDLIESMFEHIIFKPLSRVGFQADVYSCNGVICNAGFELASEALHMGKKLLVKPVHAQMEQLANAKALQILNYGSVMYDIDVGVIEQWLYDNSTVCVIYPNVAHKIVQWIQEGMPTISKSFIDNIWAEVKIFRSNGELLQY